jgi:hypothetical protein
MKSIGRQRLLAALGLFTLLAACGGGSGSSSSSSSGQPALSADQSASEQFLLAPNASYSLSWHLPSIGAPVNGVDFLREAHASMAASPLTAGTQKLNETGVTSIASTLAIGPAESPVRYLLNGTIVVGGADLNNVSYQGTGVRFDDIAADGATVVDSVLRTNYSVVQLSGAVSAAPTEFTQFFNALYFNTTLLKATATWSAGAAYVKYTSTEISDLYTVEDFAAATTGNTPTPVASGTTIATLMAAGGISSTIDATTYTLQNGSVLSINGVTTYVSSSTRPNLTTPSYRTYYELNGNVYIGNLVKAGTVLGGNPFLVAVPGSAAPTTDYTQNFQIRLNEAAVASLQTAVTF